MATSQRQPPSPPPGRGRSASEARRVGVSSLARFNWTARKIECARRLRPTSTDVEMRLWQKLRNKQFGVYFRRQHPAGSYILDFYCPALALAIDGGQHSYAAHAARDTRRDKWLLQRGVSTLRFWNSDVTENLSGVLEAIAAKIAELKNSQMTPTRRWRADLPLSGGGAKIERP